MEEVIRRVNHLLHAALFKHFLAWEANKEQSLFVCELHNGEVSRIPSGESNIISVSCIFGGTFSFQTASLVNRCSVGESRAHAYHC